MNAEQILNSVKGRIIDYDVMANGTIFVLVKSEKGNCSIRQSFRNSYGEYHGFTMVKLLSKMGEDAATIEFADLVEDVRFRLEGKSDV